MSSKNGPRTTGNIQECRELIADTVLATSARTVLAALGERIPMPPTDSSEQGMRAHRMACRNAMQAIKATIDRNKPDTLTDEKVQAVEWLASNIDFVDRTLDLMGVEGFGASIAAGQRSGRGTPLLNTAGERIGTFLPNNVLRDEDAIRNSLGAHGGGGMLDDGRMDLADFLRGVGNMRTTDSVRNALSVGTDSAGGYTVPTLLLPGIFSALVPQSALLSAGANVGILSVPAKSYNIAGVDTIPTPAWREEAASIAESDPTFRNITITPQSIAFRFKLSRELLMDGQGIEPALLLVIAQAMAKALDFYGLRGTGTAPEIRGLRNISGINTTSMGTNGATPSSYAPMVAGWKAIATENAPLPTAEIMHPRDMATFAGLVDTTGQPLRRPDLVANMTQHQTSQIPTNLTQGTASTCSEIYQGNFGLFNWYFREQLSIQVLNELHASTGEIGFIAHSRVDCAVVYPKAFNVITGVKP